jgi:hypothetical protein
MIIVFSKDRAFQVEACLRTLLAQCEDAAYVPIRVLWTASSAEHRKSYEILRESYRSKYPQLLFVEETSFRRDLVLVLGQVRPGSWRDRIIRLLLPIPMAWAQAVVAVLVNAGPTLFVVDDTLFLRPFLCAPCARHLVSPGNLAFSLRLGQSVTRSYIGQCDQKVPAMALLDDQFAIYRYKWPDTEIDFEYPLEISSSFLNMRLLLARLLRKPWKSPNTLEFALSKMAGRYKQTHPFVLTYDEPRAVSAPLNVVQKEFDNPHGGQERYHPDALCRIFLQGGRADLSALAGIRTNAVHTEIELLPSSS